MSVWKVVLAIIGFMIFAPLMPVLWGLIVAFVALLVAAPVIMIPVLLAGIGTITVCYFFAKWLIDLCSDKSNSEEKKSE